MKINQIFILLIFMVLAGDLINGQTKGLSNFYGNSQTGEDLCIGSGN